MTFKYLNFGKKITVGVVALTVAVCGLLPGTAKAESVVAVWQEDQIYHSSGWQVYDTTNHLYAWVTDQPYNSFWYGPYVSLRPAVYKACFSYRPTSNNTQVLFDYSYNAGTAYSSRMTYDNALSYYKDACVPVNANSATNQQVEFRAMLVSGSVRIDNVRLIYLWEL